MKYNNSAIDRYNEAEMRMKELLYRIGMGGKHIKRHPYYVFSLLPVFGLFIVLWLCRYKLFSPKIIPKEILALFMYVTSGLLVLMFVLLSVAVIKQIGIWASRRIESKLVIAFDNKDLKEEGYPILIAIDEKKENGILIMEFYSNIHIKRWKEKTPELEDILNLKILSIDYGGKRKEKGNHKVIYATRERVRNDTAIHDEALDKELENVN